MALIDLNFRIPSFPLNFQPHTFFVIGSWVCGLMCFGFVHGPYKFLCSVTCFKSLLDLV